jgi:hypothetical protein
LGGLQLETCPILEIPSPKITRAIRTGDVAQAVEHLLGKLKASSSNSSSAPKKKNNNNNKQPGTSTPIILATLEAEIRHFKASFGKKFVTFSSQPIAGHDGIQLLSQSAREAEIRRISGSRTGWAKYSLQDPSQNMLEVVTCTCHSSDQWWET